MAASGNFRRAAAVWTTTAALALSLAACSGQPDEKTPQDGPSPTTAAASPTPAKPSAQVTSPAAESQTTTAEPTGQPSPALSTAEASTKPGSNGRSDQESGSTSRSGTPEPESRSKSTDPAVSKAEANARFVTVNNPSSLSIVVNKQRPLQPLDFAPSELVVPNVSRAVSGESALLRKDAARALNDLFAAAARDGINLTMLSGYRSYQTQVATYNSWVARLGSVAEADTVSARPGYSEHQTGWALDIGVASGACSLQYCFNNLPASSWAANNAYKFGYIVRYQLGYHKITGYYAEPWHLRYVGEKTSRAMHRKDAHTLEKFFGLPAAPSY